MDDAAEISVIGLHGGQWFGSRAEVALRNADVLIGAARQLELLPTDLAGERINLWGALDEVIDLAGDRSAAGKRVCVLAAGDPGFFGLVRLAGARLGPARLAVHPAPSSVSLAFARVGINWDDALVVSAHGRPMARAIPAVRDHPKVAVLVSREQPPEAVGRALIEAGCGPREVAVCTRLGEPDEEVLRCDLDGLADGTFDPLSVVILCAPEAAAEPGMGLSWGDPDRIYAHRNGMITKSEVRAIALGKLALPPVGVLWDLGAGSGSVAVECARLAPGLRVFAVERRGDDLLRLRDNCAGTGVAVVAGEAPQILAGLPDPDRVFVGGGGTGVLEAALDRLRPGGAVVATYATLDRAMAAAGLLGQLVQVAISRGVPVGPERSLRLEAQNPVFVCWGPSA
ncbi:MAG: precorrin-6y C5,15-methyltransferase (decarboxylating) subunit CbiE [Acidimicrobiales bacterium]